MAERVAVVGGGAVGVTVARELAARGVEVRLFEKGPLAAESTGRAAGICYDAFADRLDARVAAEAMDRFRDLESRTRFEFIERPYVWLAREGDQVRADAIRQQVPRMCEHGRNVEFIDPSELQGRFPALSTDDIAVAAIAEDAIATDPATYTEVVAEQARATGATIETDGEVALSAGSTVETPDESHEFDAVVVATGAHTRSLLSAIDVRIPVKAYRVQALVTESTAVADETPQLYDGTAGFYCRPRDGGFLVGDGTEPRDFDPESYDRAADEAFVDAARERLAAVLGGTEVPPTDRAWAGLCTATPDRDPIVGTVAPGVWVAVGWHGHGFMRAPAIGEAVAAGVCGDEEGWQADVLSAFDPERFDGDEEFAVVEGMTLE